ncbi:MAG: nickel-dependent hydrogenase large subunit [Candidatus Acetothermia bacterium]|jgi:F420-non-reducing hydrogenase large subunit|nr:nickel-dependent hydrogenase large subunit [Candidatus Acetothermia bacterium]MDH7504764.1 nickel-dependent hydrogenase large subunit [Candidatus Acetothermia bacterium]
MAAREILLEPTRLAGQGRVSLLLDGEGQVERAYFQTLGLRAFEKLAQGRQAEYLPQLSSRISGLASWPEHLAATKALDELFQVQPPPAAKKARELLLNIAILENHLFHFFYLSGPDIFLDPGTPKAERSIIGLIAKLGPELGKQVLGLRRELRTLLLLAGGKIINPVLGLPGGIAKPLSDQKKFQAAATKALELALRTLELFREQALTSSEYLDLLKADAYTQQTYYLGLVDAEGKLNFYDGQIRVVDPQGKEWAKFSVRDYASQIDIHVEPWSYSRFLFLKKVGWRGLADGPASGLFTVGPLGRLNAAAGLATPKAAEAHQELLERLGGRPVHYTLASDWARIVEMIYAAERMGELASDPQTFDPKVRTIPSAAPKEGFGALEAPEGTVIHHYRADEQGLVTEARILLPGEMNNGRLNLAADKAARAFFKEGEVERVFLPLRGLASQGG